jgi:hypothetical protein
VKLLANVPIAAAGAIVGFVAGIYAAYLIGWHELAYVFSVAMVMALIFGLAFGRLSMSLTSSLAPKARSTVVVVGSLTAIACGILFWRVIWIL